MKLTIALSSGANAATAGEHDFASLSASRVDAAKAKIGRLEALIKKTKASKSYKTSSRLKASVERRTKMIKDLKAVIKNAPKTSAKTKAPATVKVKVDPAKRKAALEKRIAKIDAEIKAGKVMTESMAIRHSTMRGELKTLQGKGAKKPVKKVATVKTVDPKVAELQSKLESLRADLKSVRGKSPGDDRNRTLIRGEISDVKLKIVELKAKAATKSAAADKDHTGRTVRVHVKPSSKTAAKKATPKRRAKLD